MLIDFDGSEQVLTGRGFALDFGVGGGGEGEDPGEDPPPWGGDPLSPSPRRVRLVWRRRWRG
jgi:hypothetical protein